MRMKKLSPARDQIKDRFWLWGHPAGSHGVEYSLPAASRMTPVEATCYLGLNNLLLIRYSGKPTFEEFVPYAVSFRPMRRVVWSITGAGGATADDEVRRVVELAKRFPNFQGVIMDDFFREPSTGSLAVFSPEQLRQIRSQLVLPDRKLELWVTLYFHQLHDEYRESLSLCDVVTVWTWEARNLAHLEANFRRAEKLAPASRKVLGCYLYDYGTRQPMPLDRMQDQCEMGLRWLREGRIEAMIFLASCVCDIELEAVEWTRHWIAQVSGEPAGPAQPRNSGGRKKPRSDR